MIHISIRGVFDMPRQKSETLMSAIEVYLAEQDNPRTRLVYANALKQAANWLGAEKRLGDLTKMDVKRFVGSVVFCDDCNNGKPYALNTRITKLKALSVFLNWCHDLGETEERLAAAIRIPTPGDPDARDSAYTQAESDLLIAYAEGRTSRSARRLRDLTLFLLAHDTGARRETLARIQRKHINLDRGILRLHNVKRRRWYEAAIGSYTAEVLAERLSDLPGRRTDYLWHSRKPGEVMKTASVGQIVKRACLEMGVPPKGIHGWRRMFAARMLDEGFSVEYVADILDDDVQTVKRHYAPSHIPAAKEAARAVSYVPPTHRKVRRFDVS
jgi:integrase